MQEVHSTRRPWVVIALLFGFMMLNFADKVAVGLLAQPLMHDLHLTPTQFGMLGSAFFALYSISGIAGGFLIDRVGARWLIFGMVAIWSLTQLPLLAVSGFGALVVCRLLLGIAEGPAWPAAMTVCHHWFSDKQRNLPSALLSQGSIAGLLLAGPVLTGVAAKWGWRASFGLLGALGFIWCIAWLVWGQEKPVNRPQTVQNSRANTLPATAPGLTADTLEAKRSYWQLLFRPTMLFSIAAYFASFWAASIGLTWGPAYLHMVLGYSQSQAGWFFSVIIAINAPVGLLLSWASQRWIKRGVSSRYARAVFAGTCLVLSGICYFAFTSGWFSAPVQIVLFGVSGALSAVIITMGPVIISEITPARQRASMLAVQSSIAAIAGFIAPTFVGKLLQSSASAADAFAHSFAVSGTLMVVFGVLAAIFMRPDIEQRRALDAIAGADRPGTDHSRTTTLA